MYKIDWGILRNNSISNKFNEELKLLAKDVIFKDVKYDRGGDVEYLIMQNGSILANNGHSPTIMELSDYFSYDNAILVDEEVKALVKFEGTLGHIYTHQQKLEILFVGKTCYFVKDDMGNEFALEKDSSEIVDLENPLQTNKLEVDIGDLKKEDFLKALEIIKKGVLSSK